MAKFLHDHPEAEVVQAIPRVADADNSVITRLNAYEMRFWYQGLHAAKDRYGLFVHLAGTGMFLKREVFDRVGPWDEECLTEDLDFARRHASLGGKVALMQGEVWIQPTYSVRDLLRQRQRWWTGALQVFWKYLRTPANRTLPFRMRADTATYLASPLVFLVSSLAFLASLGFVAAIGNVSYAVAAWIFGFLGTNFLVVPLIFVESAFRRKARLLLLIPGLYWYWLLQIVALGSALIRLGVGVSISWEKTPKRRWNKGTERGNG
jgi:cellulose synthase/poly-beta-1,6-N-acetylglucosamine synthase-like glycosyltransferase